MKAGLCPDMPFYVEDWLISPTIATMTPSQEGGYIRLLCYGWRDPDCCLPGDAGTLASLSRLGPEWKTLGDKILACFEPDPDRPGFIFNETQRALRRAQSDRIQTAR